MSLAAEIQHQLLPSPSCCEAPQFTLAGALIPADSVAGDSYDYTLDRETVHMSITDAMGHDVDAALMATLLVNALRRARRGGYDAARQAGQAHQAMRGHGRGVFVTGQLLRISLDGSGAQIVNAGHPWPLRLRVGRSSPGQPSRLLPGPGPVTPARAPARGGQRRPFCTRCRQPSEGRCGRLPAGLPAIPLPPWPGRE